VPDNTAVEQAAATVLSLSESSVPEGPFVMNAHQAIQLVLDDASMITNMYLSDLTDADLLARPVPGANHIAWQLGHLLLSGYRIVEAVAPGALPALPADFAEKYTTETAALDDPAAFHTKQVYLDAYEQQWSAIRKALDGVSEADLDKPAPEQFRSFLKSVGHAFSLQASHWLMHAGQWAIIRRKLGRPPLF
jgi:hypothetical protein